MAANYDATTKGLRMQAVLDQIDNHASPAYIEIATSGFASILATIVLSDPSFSRSGSVLTMLGVPKSDVADATGTAAVARIKDGGGTTKVDGLVVGAGSGEISLNSTSLTTGQTVTITAGTISHA